MDSTAGGARGDEVVMAVTRETRTDGGHVVCGGEGGERRDGGARVENVHRALHGAAEHAVARGGPDGAEWEDPSACLVVVFDFEGFFRGVGGWMPDAEGVVVARGE